MTDRTHLTTVETVREEQSWLFTARDQYDEPEEIILVPCEDGDDTDRDGTADNPGVEAWVNRCTHEAQRLDRGFGAAMRDGEIICPKHGSMFDSCSGYCDNGEAADTTLISVAVGVEEGEVYLTDESYEFGHEGGVEDGPSDGDNRGDRNGRGNGDGGGDEDSEQNGSVEDNENESDDDDDMPSSTSHIGF